MNRDKWIMVVKIAVGTTLAILIAEAMNLTYATSAGTVALLTILNTRKDTLQLAGKRILSFCVTILLLFLCEQLISGKVLAFLVFMLFLVAITYYFGWNGALSVNEVIGAHVLFSDHMLDMDLVYNEAAMVGIGILMAVLLNMRMPGKEEEIQDDIQHIDEAMGKNLHDIADHLANVVQLNADQRHLEHLSDHVLKALEKAYINKDNSLKSHSEYYVHYLELREDQCDILMHIYQIASSHTFAGEEAEIVAEGIREVALKLDVRKDAAAAQHKMKKLANSILYGDMPTDHKELESKAVLYQVLNELLEFMRRQENFQSRLTEEQILAYWY